MCFSKGFLSSVLLFRVFMSLQLNEAAKDLSWKKYHLLGAKKRIDWNYIYYNTTDIKIETYNISQLQVCSNKMEITCHLFFMFYLHKLMSKNIHMLLSQRLNRASSVRHIILCPCHPCGHFLLSQWLKRSIIRGPVMENSDCFSLLSVHLPGLPSRMRD